MKILAFVLVSLGVSGALIHTGYRHAFACERLTQRCAQPPQTVLAWTEPMLCVLATDEVAAIHDPKKKRQACLTAMQTLDKIQGGWGR